MSEADIPDPQRPADRAFDPEAPDAGASTEEGTERPEDDTAPGEATVDDPQQPESPAAGAAPHDVVATADADPRSRHELHHDLLEAEAKRDEYLDDLRRAYADFENYRKRVMREGTAQRQAGKAEVANALLDVLDDLDRTLDAAEGSADADLAKGVELVATKLRDALAGIGLERIDAVEVAFDPTVHEAVQHMPADDADGEPTVAQVLRPGYRLGDRTLRAAMVAVAG